MLDIYRNLFLLFTYLSIILGMTIGVYGMEHVGKSIFGPSFGVGPPSWELIPVVVFTVFGTLIGVGGMFFVVIMPLTFLFPNISESPSWVKQESLSPEFIKRFYLWYSHNLSKVVEDEFEKPNK